MKRIFCSLIILLLSIASIAQGNVRITDIIGVWEPVEVVRVGHPTDDEYTFPTEIVTIAENACLEFTADGKLIYQNEGESVANDFLFDGHTAVFGFILPQKLFGMNHGIPLTYAELGINFISSDRMIMRINVCPVLAIDLEMVKVAGGYTGMEGAEIYYVTDDGEEKTSFPWLPIGISVTSTIGVGGFIFTQVVRSRLRAKQMALEAEQRRKDLENRRIWEEQHRWTQKEIDKMSRRDTAYDRHYDKISQELRERQAHEEYVDKVKERRHMSYVTSDDQVRGKIAEDMGKAEEESYYQEDVARQYEEGESTLGKYQTVADVGMAIADNTGVGKPVAKAYTVGKNFATEASEFYNEGPNRTAESFFKHLAKFGIHTSVELGQGSVGDIKWKYITNPAGDVTKVVTDQFLDGKKFDGEFGDKVINTAIISVANTGVEHGMGKLMDGARASDFAKMKGNLKSYNNKVDNLVKNGLSEKAGNALKAANKTKVVSQQARNFREWKIASPAATAALQNQVNRILSIDD